MLKKANDIAELLPIMQSVFDDGKTVKITASGGSMRPLLRSGIDAVVLGRCDDAESLKKYDVPLYRRDDGKCVLHRIVAVHDDCFDMCGDAQINIERGVKKSAVCAKAVGFYSHGHYFSADGIVQKAYATLWCAVLPYRFKIAKIVRFFRRK